MKEKVVVSLCFEKTMLFLSNFNGTITTKVKARHPTVIPFEMLMQLHHASDSLHIKRVL